MRSLQRCTRRGFLAQAAAGGAAATVVAHSRMVWGYAANEKLHIALVGVGGRGTWFVETIPRMEQVVALCDVNQKKIDEAFSRWAELSKRFAVSEHVYERRAAAEFQRLIADKPETFGDFRKMLDQMGKQIDGVVVATPDHTHAVASAAAIRAGKAVFCEKPLTRTVHEARALRELARKYKVATAMGNQGTYSGPFRRALELIRDGTLGQIKEVHVWNSGGGADAKEPPRGEEPVPEGLDWDLWLGPAAFRPYNRQWMMRNRWREFGTCQLGNWGPHSANLGFMALKVHELWLGQPSKDRPVRLEIEARHSGVNKLSFPRWEVINWSVPARAEFPPITITWYNGSQAPGFDELLRRALPGMTDKEKNLWQFAGTLIVGTKGSIHATGHNAWFRLLPAENFQGVQTQRPEQVENSRGPEQDWFAAIRGGKAPWSNFDYASALGEFLMLGNVATQFESKLVFDPVEMKVVNNAEADALLRSDYRTGWTL